MDLVQSADEIAFRHEVRDFLAKELPETLRFRTDGAQLSSREQTLAWQNILFRKGWAAPHWDKADGGTGWTPYQRMIFEVECALAGVPWINQQGMNLLGPIVNAFGTPEQRQRFVDPLLRGETYWCQGFSEPNAGSDLASVQTFAQRDGNSFRVTGQKIWTSHAELADWIFLLVRTERSPKKQNGISFLVSPTNAPGITIRPIKSIDGLHHLTEVFLDNVEIPSENLIGEEGQGWYLAKRLLGKERVFGACDIPGMLREMARLKSAASDIGADQLPQDLLVRIGRADMEAEVATMAFVRAISHKGSESAYAVISSALKVRVTELHQHILDLFFELMGHHAPLLYPDPCNVLDHPLPVDSTAPLAKISSELMYRRAGSIYGGTNEIQRDIIAKVMLS